MSEAPAFYVTRPQRIADLKRDLDEELQRLREE